jgi:hypothetical protein
MLKKGRTRFRSNYHPELSVEDMLSINSIQRRTVTTCLNTDQVMFSLLSIQLHKNSTSREAQNAMNGKLEYEYFRLQKLEKMFWNRTYGHENHLLSEKLTSMLMVNVLCKTKKGYPIGDGVIKQIEDTVRNRLLCFNYSLVRRYRL